MKPMYLYLACDCWRQHGVLDGIRVVLLVPTPSLFGMPLIDTELERKVADYGIEVRYSRELVEVDSLTLRHRCYPDVWALGDAAATFNSKSGGALRQQTKVLAKNLSAALKGKALPETCNCYSVCPFVVSRSSVVFAEFDDRYRPKPTIPFWRGLAKERRSTFVADRYILPWVH